MSQCALTEKQIGNNRGEFQYFHVFFFPLLSKSFCCLNIDSTASVSSQRLISGRRSSFVELLSVFKRELLCPQWLMLQQFMLLHTSFSTTKCLKITSNVSFEFACYVVKKWDLLVLFQHCVDSRIRWILSNQLIVWKLLKMSHLNFGIFHQLLSF